MKKMTQKKRSTVPDLEKTDSANLNIRDDIEMVSNSFESSFLKKSIAIIPFVYLLRIIVAYPVAFTFVTNDVVSILTQVSFIVAFLLSSSFLEYIPFGLNTLFLEGIINSKSNSSSPTQYSIKRYKFLLNHRFRIIFGGMASLLLLVYHYQKISEYQKILQTKTFLVTPDLIINVCSDVFFAYFVGLIFWKMLVTCWYFLAIPDYYDLNIKHGHPDGAGGLLPIGIVGLKMIYISMTPSILSVTLIILSFTNIPTMTANDVLLFRFAPLGLAFGLLGTIIGIIPIIKIHQNMVEKKITQTSKLNQIVNVVLTLKEEQLKLMDKGDFKKNDDLNKTILSYENLHKEIRNYRTWPLNKEITTQIAATQTLLLGQAFALIELLSKLSA